MESKRNGKNVRSTPLQG